jgi:hypothetical protein
MPSEFFGCLVEHRLIDYPAVMREPIRHHAPACSSFVQAEQRISAIAHGAAFAHLATTNCYSRTRHLNEGACNDGTRRSGRRFLE